MARRKKQESLESERNPYMRRGEGRVIWGFSDSYFKPFPQRYTVLGCPFSCLCSSREQGIWDSALSPQI